MAIFFDSQVTGSSSSTGLFGSLTTLTGVDIGSRTPQSATVEPVLRFTNPDNDTPNNSSLGLLQFWSLDESSGGRTSGSMAEIDVRTQVNYSGTTDTDMIFKLGDGLVPAAGTSPNTRELLRLHHDGIVKIENDETEELRNLHITSIRKNQDVSATSAAGRYNTLQVVQQITSSNNSLDFTSAAISASITRGNLVQDVRGDIIGVGSSLNLAGTFSGTHVGGKGIGVDITTSTAGLNSNFESYGIRANIDNANNGTAYGLHITAPDNYFSGNVSGSATSTGSFGHLLVNGSVVGGSSPDATDGSQDTISGSAASTGSFGQLETVGDLKVAIPSSGASGFRVDTSVEGHTELKLNNRTFFLNDDIIAIGEDTAPNDIAHQKGGGAGGRSSVYIGNEAGENVDNSDGGAANNTFIGFAAGQDVTSGEDNTFLGSGTGENVTTGNNNVIIGQASKGNTDIDSNVIIGHSAGTKVGANGGSADHNIILGSGTVSLIGGDVDHNIIMGYRASRYLGDAQGDYNVHLGYEAASNVVTASYNVVLGYQAMEDAGGASSGGNHVTKNVAIGYRPLVKIDENAQFNIAIGTEVANNNTTGSNNIIMGYRVAYQNSGDLGQHNIIMGTSGGNNIDGGDYNVILGRQAGTLLTTASDNILIGQSAGYNQTTGNHIIALGKNAGRGSGVTADTNASSIFIGKQAYSGESGATNETVIGTDAIGKGSNTVVLGDDNVTDIYLSEDNGATVHGGLFSGSFYQEFLHNFQDDLNTTGHFVPWVGNAESTGNNNANTAYMSPYDMTLQRIIIRPETLSSTDTFNVIIVKQDDGDTTNDTVATATSAGNHADNTAIVINQSDFNATPSVGALDKVSIKILPASDLSGTIDWYITSIWKVDKIL